jgi:hypothetical protein
MTQEEKILRSKALSEAWKKRPGYIADIVNNNPRLYNSWRSIRFTEKGRLAGCCDRWKDFRTFYEDVAPSYFKGCRLLRRDKFKPWSKDNFMCVSEEEAGAINESVFIEYDGQRLSLRRWAEKLGISYNALKIRYYRRRTEYSPEELLFGKRKRRGFNPAKDIKDSGVNIRAKASKMISQYRVKDRSNGCELCDISIDWMVENILEKPCVYCGDTSRVGCDRIDNSRGHTKDNVVPCCIECNTARNNYFTYEEMKILGRTIKEIKQARYGLR